jgi:type II secretory pathway pseudopilin PulG
MLKQSYLHLKGFTAFELLIVVVLLGLITVLLGRGFNLSQISQRLKVKNASDELKILLKDFNYKSLASKNRYSLTCKSNESCLVLVNEKQDARKLGRSIEFENHKFEFLKELTKPKVFNLTFYPSGVTTPKTFLLGRGSYGCRVIMSLRGNIHTKCSNY